MIGGGLQIPKRARGAHSAIGRLRAVCAAILIVAVSACVSAGEATPSPADAAARDEAAVRARLAFIEETFNAGDLDAFMSAFADDVILLGEANPAVVGKDAARAVYATMFEQADMTLHFQTEEVAVSGDLAFERGTFTTEARDTTSGAVLGRTEARHIHILRRGPDGEWLSWRLMTNTAE